MISPSALFLHRLGSRGKRGDNATRKATARTARLSRSRGHARRFRVDPRKALRRCGDCCAAARAHGWYAACSMRRAEELGMRRNRLLALAIVVAFLGLLRWVAPAPAQRAV